MSICKDFIFLGGSHQARYRVKCKYDCFLFNTPSQHFNMMSARSVYYMIQDEEDIRAYYRTHIMSLRVSGKMAVTKKLLVPIYLRTSVSL